ncbi:hypothetical protein [Phenylobacterium sp.]|uniref:hypothetical protein n=1 Tax=Phenylobacterium sp. TaxID=1871053 RepID=UPI0025D57959|nr:hypothetical protein [Phenylobacterium sp.]
MLRTWMLAAVIAAGPSAAAMAQDATGDWIGKVKAGGDVELTIATQIKAGPGGALESFAESPDQTPMPLAMTDIAVKDGVLSFKAPIANATYSGKWDAAVGGWVGALSQGGAEMPLTLVHGRAGPRPVVTGLDGDWSGVLAVPQGDLHLVMHVKTDANGALAMFSSPDQSPIEMAAVLTHQGEAVTIQTDGCRRIGRWNPGSHARPS